MIDETKIYIVPMVKISDKHIEEPVEVNILIDKYGITCKKDGYQQKYFYKEYFEWLIYRKYIKVE